MEPNQPLISVVIPVKNGAPWLHKTISAILAQTLASKTEIIAIDSGSTDESIGILAGFPVTTIKIPSESFNHGAVRNLGAQKAAGTFVVMTVQDAEAADTQWLEKMLAGFQDENVAGVCGEQIVPHLPQNNPVDWFRPISEPIARKVVFENPADFEKLPDADKAEICRWDDVNAMYKRSALIEVPFREVSFAEDALWAKDALTQGMAIVYQPSARVKHYHIETPAYVFRRKFTEYFHIYKFFGVKPVPVRNGAFEILRNLKLLVSDNKISWAQKIYWLSFNIKRRNAINDSVKQFNEALDAGEKMLEQKHSEITKIPIQALNTKSFNQ